VIPKIKRWQLEDVNEGTQEPQDWDMVPSKFGVYVEFDDHKKIVEALQAEIDRLKGGQS
jgi:hypothetical protein